MNKYRCVRPFKNMKCSKSLRIVNDSVNVKLAEIMEDYDMDNLHNKRICSSCYLRLNTPTLKNELDVTMISSASEPQCFDLQESEQVIPSTSGFQQQFQENKGLKETEESDSTDKEESTSGEEKNGAKEVAREELINNINLHIAPHVVEKFSPLKKKLCVGNSRYMKQKSEQITNSIQRSLVADIVEPLEENIAVNYYNEMIQNLKFMFDNGDYSEKMKVIKILPSKMSLSEIQLIFGKEATRYLVETSRDQYEKSKQCQLNPTSELKRTPDPSNQKIINFYLNDQISKIMPGMRDAVSVKRNNERVYVQKRLLLCSLNEAYTEFKKKYPEIKVGFTKFTTLRPEECVKFGHGIHNVCVCTIHQNIKLMFQHSKLNTLSSRLQNYKSLIDFVNCGDNNDACYTMKCNNCINNLDNLSGYLNMLFNNHGIQEVKYSQWNTTDRCNLDTIIDTPSTFTTNFMHRLKILIPHHFISKQQSMFIESAKANLRFGELLVQGDFSENYSFVIQDAVQGYHWNNSQATIHPFVIYYKIREELEHKSFVVISNIMQHDSIAVYLYIKKLINYIKSDINSSTTKIIYNTDGAGSQYKNKYNFINLVHHKEDFGIDAEWHFHATSHGKGPCDGIGGSLKRAAHRYSLANKAQIRSPEELYIWTQTWNSNMSFVYSSEEEYGETKSFLQSRYSKAVTIRGTQSFHAFIPLDKRNIVTKLYSNSLNIVNNVISH